nr:MAG TPA: hypothetical protein [Caudoviricetes sp.]
MTFSIIKAVIFNLIVWFICIPMNNYLCTCYFNFLNIIIFFRFQIFHFATSFL